MISRAAALLLLCQSALWAAAPNVLWFVVDDMSANFSCYGEQAIRTPHVDQLANAAIDAMLAAPSGQ